MFKREFVMWQRIDAAALILLILAPFAQAGAQDLSGADMKSLDGQVQEIKSDVLNIASELNNLEERLLYPSNTQLSVFVALAPDETFRLDAVQVMIDGEMATHHIYSFKELEALQKGGVQRVYTGNVPTGDHQISVTVNGKLKNGNDFSESSSFTFSKGVKPKALGLTLAQPGFGSEAIRVGDW
jgi:archaellum component FlaG (FlaF/FlaG flagellin family)